MDDGWMDEEMQELVQGKCHEILGKVYCQRDPGS
jgi:hypothetical protein